MHNYMHRIKKKKRLIRMIFADLVLYNFKNNMHKFCKNYVYPNFCINYTKISNLAFVITRNN